MISVLVEHTNLAFMEIIVCFRFFLAVLFFSASPHSYPGSLAFSCSVSQLVPHLFLLLSRFFSVSLPPSPSLLCFGGVLVQSALLWWLGHLLIWGIFQFVWTSLAHTGSLEKGKPCLNCDDSKWSILTQASLRWHKYPIKRLQRIEISPRKLGLHFTRFHRKLCLIAVPNLWLILTRCVKMTMV